MERKAAWAKGSASKSIPSVHPVSNHHHELINLVEEPVTFLGLLDDLGDLCTGLRMNPGDSLTREGEEAEEPGSGFEQHLVTLAEVTPKKISFGCQR